MSDAVGETGPERTRTIDRRDIARYAGASGDFNRSHVDEEFTTAVRGHESVFAMGMLSGGLAGGFVQDWFGLDAIERLEMRFEAVVYPGDEITVGGEVVAADPETVEARIEGTNRDDEVVLSGSVTARV